MSTLYIRLPSKVAADSAPHVIDLACPFAIASDNGVLEREGVSMLSQLVDAITQAQRVVLLLAASDVNLLHVKVPPMSASRLKAALPNLIEEQLISDPAECLIVAGPPSDGLRTVAVVNRVWLELLAKTLVELGARNVVALPAQLCLPHQEGMVVAAVHESHDDINLTLRLSEQEGIGMSIVPEQHATIAHDVAQTLCSVVPTAPIALYVQSAEVSAYQAALSDGDVDGDEQRISVFADSWPHWIESAKTASLNLMSGLGLAAGPGFNWAMWRWPITLAIVAIVVNLSGLQVEWWRLKHEEKSLRAGMTKTFKAAYPKEPVTADPAKQMQMKIAQARHGAGQSSPSDFIALTAVFGEEWRNVMQGSTTPGIAALDYAERNLLVRLKLDGAAPTAQMKAALAARNVSLVEQKPGEWLIGSTK